MTDTFWFYAEEILDLGGKELQHKITQAAIDKWEAEGNTWPSEYYDQPTVDIYVDSFGNVCVDIKP